MSKLEQEAKKWFLNKVDKDKRKAAEAFLQDEENLKELIEEYKQSEQYKQSNKFRNKLKVTLGVGVATAGVIVGANILSSERAEMKIEDTNKTEVDENKINNQENVIEGYDEFFNSIENEKNTDKRDKIIHEKTKEIIVEAYNMQSEDKQITTDNLEILILNENVLEKKDRLGNSTYERIEQNIIVEQAEDKRLVKLGAIYVFSIDGQTVAVYDKNGDRLEDKSIKQEEIFFKSTLDIIKQSEKLKDTFKYQTNENYCNVAESKFENIANELLEHNRMNKDIKQEISEISE